MLIEKYENELSAEIGEVGEGEEVFIAVRAYFCVSFIHLLTDTEDLSVFINLRRQTTGISE